MVWPSHSPVLRGWVRLGNQIQIERKNDGLLTEGLAVVERIKLLSQTGEPLLSYKIHFLLYIV